MGSGRVVVIGDEATLPLFRSMGAVTFEAGDESEAIDAIRRASSMGDVALIIVLKHLVKDPDAFRERASAVITAPVLILPTRWSPAEPIDVNKLIARALGFG